MNHDRTYHLQIYWIEIYWIKPELSPRMHGVVKQSLAVARGRTPQAKESASHED
jgi:hypothetical protein